MFHQRYIAIHIQLFYRICDKCDELLTYVLDDATIVPCNYNLKAMFDEIDL